MIIIIIKISLILLTIIVMIIKMVILLLLLLLLLLLIIIIVIIITIQHKAHGSWGVNVMNSKLFPPVQNPPEVEFLRSKMKLVPEVSEYRRLDSGVRMRPELRYPSRLLLSVVCSQSKCMEQLGIGT